MKNSFILLFSAGIFYSTAFFSQCSIASSNGYTVTVGITPTQAIPEFTVCPWYYHYEVRYNYTITFTGSTTGRSFSANAYFNCTGGTGGQPYKSMGTFTANASGTMTTSNNSRQYSAIGPAFNYGSNPSCTTVTVADINCTSVQLSYWGNGISNGSIVCSFAAPLPIELSSFTATPENDAVRLNWTTVSETNNKAFVIERSMDAAEWSEAFTLAGAGNSNEVKKYSGLDEKPLSGISYYRLKQIDFNGDYKYSPVIVIDRSQSTAPDFIAFPNPASETVTIAGKEEASSIELINQLGQKMEVTVFKNENASRLDVSSIPSGLYTIIVRGVNGAASTRQVLINH